MGYTFDPESWLLNSEYHRDLGDGFTLSTNVFGRFLSIEQFNPGVDEEVRAHTLQRGWGGTAQISYQGKWLNLSVTAAAGLDYNGARLNYRIDGREIDRSASGEKEPFAVATKIHTQTHGGGAFVTLTVEPVARFAITAAGRFDVTSLQIDDQLANRSGDEGSRTDTSGSHRFTRFNPSLGATYALTNSLSLYAGYSQSYRTPTAVELTCANPDAPCPVPTAIVDDPPLKPVKGKTWETGVRWSPVPSVRTTLAFFRTDLEDDILFRNEPRSQLRGFFQNIGTTRRQGIELLLQGTWGRAQWYADYTLTDATFEDDIELFTFASEDRIAHVCKGDRLPLVPSHRIAGGVEFALTSSLRIDLDGTYVGSQYLRGDEDNKRRRLSSYFVANMQLTYSLQSLDVFFRLENMFDANYESYGAFAENRRDGTGLERFLGPGAPLGAFGGVRMKF